MLTISADRLSHVAVPIFNGSPSSGMHTKVHQWIYHRVQIIERHSPYLSELEGHWYSERVSDSSWKEGDQTGEDDDGGVDEDVFTVVGVAGDHRDYGDVHDGDGKERDEEVDDLNYKPIVSHATEVASVEANLWV